MNYELIQYNENLPFKIIILEAENQQYHLHKEMELVFLLKGNLIFEVKGRKHTLSEHDLFWINSLDAHSILSPEGENVMLTLQLDTVFFDQYCPEFSSFYYEYTDNINNRSNPIYHKLTSYLAEMMLSIIKSDMGYKLKTINSIIQIAVLFLQNFRTEKLQQNINDLYKQQRLSKILNFLEDNYNDNITLDTLSNEMNVSPQYISKFFKNNFGIGFVDYLNKLRISKSLNDLLGNTKTIIDIAIEHGFNDHKAYNRVFKKEYQMTATEYRKKISEQTPTKVTTSSGYFDDNSSSYFKYLFEFLNKDRNSLNELSTASDKLNINIDLANSTPRHYEKYWNKITSIGRVALCLRREIQNQLRITQKEIGFEYIRFHGIFSDEMMLYGEDSEGNAIYNWTYVDEIFDFFYEIKLKPFIEIGFMPELLASKKQFSPFSWKANVSYPKSLKRWKSLVSEFIKHLVNRYGIEEVEKWYFEIWSVPDIPNFFWFESKKSFFQFYKETHFSIKEISPNFKVGSPGILPINDFQWFEEFLNYCKNNSIILDFGASHIYTYTDPQIETLPIYFINDSNSFSDKDFLENTVIALKNKIKQTASNDMKLFVTEWNLSPLTKDYNRDTCFLSTYIIYNILNNIGNLDGLAFWTLSDILEAAFTEDKLFHGGQGLFTYNGLKKTAYNAFLLLNKLGDKIIEKGKDYIITYKNNSYQILIYNFVYFDDLFRTGDKSLLSYHERYNIFKTTYHSKDVNIILSLDKGDYKVKKIRLNRESGSIFDAWIKMGAPEDIQPDVYAFLKSKETPEIIISTETVKKQLLITESVPTHGVVFIEISK